MYRCFLSSLLLSAVTHVALASGDIVPDADNADAKPAPPKASVALVASAEERIKEGTLFLSTPDNKAISVLFDYTPFRSSGFNLSAGSVTSPQTRSLNSAPKTHRAYLGLGWKKLLDDAQNFGIRVDVGAIYDDQSELENQVSNLRKSRDTQKSATPSDWNPVVSLGVSYRF